MRELSLEVMDLQSQWSDRNTPAMARRGVIVRDLIPAWLKSVSSDIRSSFGAVGADISFEGRDGTGRKTEIPWMRFYSKSRSPNAREGWYCVYLFHARGDGLYLSLIHGATRYERGEFRRKSPEELGALVRWARGILSSKLDPKLTVPPSLDARKSDLGAAYADGTVASIWYPRNAVPDSDTLLRDAQRFAGLLAEIYNNQDLGRTPESSAPEVDAASFEEERIANPLRRRALSGQGYGLTPSERRAVELHAMTRARVYLEGTGISVQDVSATQSFDYRALQGAEELLVEVKGTTGNCGSVLLTAQEVALHRVAYPKNILIVVYDIDLDRNPKSIKASGGRLKVFKPWRIDPEMLSATAYKYEVPHDGYSID